MPIERLHPGVERRSRHFAILLRDFTTLGDNQHQQGERRKDSRLHGLSGGPRSIITFLEQICNSWL